MVAAWDSPEAEWVRSGSDLFGEALQSVSDLSLSEDCGLDGWTRAHLTAHVAANAQAIGRLLHWASTGEPTPMYASMEERDREIAAGAARSPEELRDWWSLSDNELQRGFASLDPQAWDQIVVTAQGREVPASETLWMRSREVCIHAVDLCAGTSFQDLPEGFLRRLVSEAAAKHSAGRKGPTIQIEALEGGTWQIVGDGEEVALTGTLAGLASWLTGRGALDLRMTDGSVVPELGKWL